jgi:hypothetical protein
MRIDQARQEQGVAKIQLAPGSPLSGQFRPRAQGAYGAVRDGKGAVRKGVDRRILCPAEDMGGVKHEIAGTGHSCSPDSHFFCYFGRIAWSAPLVQEKEGLAVFFSQKRVSFGAFRRYFFEKKLCLIMK